MKDQDIRLTFTDNSIKWLVEVGYDMEFGARPLRRIVQTQVETMIARKIIAREIAPGDAVEVYYSKSIGGLGVRIINNHLADTEKLIQNVAESSESTDAASSAKPEGTEKADE